MKSIITAILLSMVFAQNLSAQSNTNVTYFPESREEKPNTSIKNFYLGLGTGLNNNVGILGVTGEYNIYKNFCGYAGAGLGTWGYKVTVGGKIYLNYPLGSAFIISYTYVTGVNGIKTNLEVQNLVNGVKSRQDVTFNAKPANLINLGWQNHWRVSDVVRFNIELGYSINLNRSFDQNYTITSNTLPLSEASLTVMRILQPGGIIIGLGFTFGIN